MVALTERIQRLTLETVVLAHPDGTCSTDTTAIRCLDWDRERFDIEFALSNGTTYNSFLIRGEKIALVDTSHEKFRRLYLDTLKGLIDPSTIDYLVISHTEPDHSGLVADLLKLAPHITVVGAKVAIQFLEDLVHQPFERKLVKNGADTVAGPNVIPPKYTKPESSDLTVRIAAGDNTLPPITL